MSHFYASIQGRRGEATRQGTKTSGISGHIRGWTAGVMVSGDRGTEADLFTVRQTSGSGGSGHSRRIAEITSGPEPTILYDGPNTVIHLSDERKDRIAAVLSAGLPIQATLAGVYAYFNQPAEDLAWEPETRTVGGLSTQERAKLAAGLMSDLPYEDGTRPLDNLLPDAHLESEYEERTALED